MPASRDTSTPSPLSWSSGLWVVSGLVLAGVWRLLLGSWYAGWEESDYGNLAMIQGVLAGGFRHYDMNHMPGYYAASAMVHAVVSDAVIAGRTVALLGGLVAWVGGVWLAWRVGGRLAAAIAGLLLITQPEFALYAASTLREPMYAAGLVGFVAGLILRRPGLAALAGVVAFSVRFDAVAILPAIATIHAIRMRSGWRAWLGALLPVFVAVILWSVYCRYDHGTYQFWSHSVGVNLETGLGAESEGPVAWAMAGLWVSVRLVAWLLPWRVGWGVWLAAVGMLVAVRWRAPHPIRTLAAGALIATSFWGAVGFVGQHSPEHNLYWKWMMPLVPLVVPLGAVGLSRAHSLLSVRFGPWIAGIALAAVLGQAFLSHGRETHRQLALSEELYAPQVALGRWFEDEVPESTTVLVDNIPACWINRQPNERQMVSWFDVPVKGGGEPLADWLTTQGVPWVIWFREDWTQAPAVAPELASGGTVRVGQLSLIERAREDAYGWILYEVTGEGIPEHMGAPPPGMSRSD